MIQVIKSAFKVDDEPIYLGYTNGANGEHNIDTPNTLEGWNEIVDQCYAEQISGCLLTCEQKTFRGYQFNGYVWRELH